MASDRLPLFKAELERLLATRCPKSREHTEAVSLQEPLLHSHSLLVQVFPIAVVEIDCEDGSLFQLHHSPRARLRESAEFRVSGLSGHDGIRLWVCLQGEPFTKAYPLEFAPSSSRQTSVAACSESKLTRRLLSPLGWGVTFLTSERKSGARVEGLKTDLGV